MPIETIIVLCVVCALFATFMAVLFWVSLPSQSHWDGSDLPNTPHLG